MSGAGSEGPDRFLHASRRTLDEIVAYLDDLSGTEIAVEAGAGTWRYFVTGVVQFQVIAPARRGDFWSAVAHCTTESLGFEAKKKEG